MQFFSFKDESEWKELQYLHPAALMVFADLVRFCHDSKMPAPVITCLLRTPEENEAVGAESDSHVTRRAFDVRSSTYTKGQIESIVNYMNTQWTKYAAINSHGQVRLAVHHKTTQGALHFHFQINRRYSLPKWEGLSE
jgi:hypothetical protein